MDMEMNLPHCIGWGLTEKMLEGPWHNWLRVGISDDFYGKGEAQRQVQLKKSLRYTNWYFELRKVIGSKSDFNLKV